MNPLTIDRPLYVDSLTTVPRHLAATPEPSAHTCPRCGKTAYLAGKRGGCPECRGVSAPETGLLTIPFDQTTRICGTCGESFTPHAPNHRYCSEACHPSRLNLDATCDRCGAPYKRRKGSPAQRFCSRECSAAHTREYRTEWMRKARGKS